MKSHIIFVFGKRRTYKNHSTFERLHIQYLIQVIYIWREIYSVTETLFQATCPLCVCRFKIK